MNGVWLLGWWTDGFRWLPAIWKSHCNRGGYFCRSADSWKRVSKCGEEGSGSRCSTTLWWRPRQWHTVFQLDSSWNWNSFPGRVTHLPGARQFRDAVLGRLWRRVCVVNLICWWPSIWFLWPPHWVLWSSQRCVSAPGEAFRSCLSEPWLCQHIWSGGKHDVLQEAIPTMPMCSLFVSFGCFVRFAKANYVARGGTSCQLLSGKANHFRHWTTQSALQREDVAKKSKIRLNANVRTHTTQHLPWSTSLFRLMVASRCSCSCGWAHGACASVVRSAPTCFVTHGRNTRNRRWLSGNDSGGMRRSTICDENWVPAHVDGYTAFAAESWRFSHQLCRRPGRRGSHTTARTPNVHISRPRRFKHHQKFHEKTHREREKERKWERKREKKERHVGPSRPVGTPPFGATTLRGPTLPLLPSFPDPPTLFGQIRLKKIGQMRPNKVGQVQHNTTQKNGLAKIGLAKMAKPLTTNL